jgi:general secretion pathway protein A
MYESHWELQEKPFEAGADARFYFPSQSHQAALLKLRYAVESRRGATLLAGPCGVGKTLVVALLRQVLGPDFAPFVHLVFPQFSGPDLLCYLAMEMTGAESEPPASLPVTIRRLEHFLAENAQQNRHAVVVVDEAQLLDDPSILETLRLLLNFETAGRPGLTLMLCGQTGLLPLLERVPQLEERFGVKCLLRAFPPQETADYVRHRLEVAGAKRAIFDPPALVALHELTQGIPRRINRLADLALLIGYAEGLRTITAAHLEAVHAELVTVSID